MDYHEFARRLKELGVQPVELSNLERVVDTEAVKTLLIQAGILRSKEQWEEAVSKACTKLLKTIDDERAKGIAWEDIEDQL